MELSSKILWTAKLDEFVVGSDTTESHFPEEDKQVGPSPAHTKTKHVIILIKSVEGEV